MHVHDVIYAYRTMLMSSMPISSSRAEGMQCHNTCGQDCHAQL